MAEYAITIRSLSPDEGGGFLATVPALPGCMSDGETEAEARENVKDAIVQWLATDQGRRAAALSELAAMDGEMLP